MELQGSWRREILKHFPLEKLNEIKSFLEEQRLQGKRVYPQEEDVFKAFELTPLENVKAVIIGQDPYHGPNQAHGLAFSVNKSERLPPSLKNIFKELSHDLGASFPSHGNLESWAKEGVFLYNTCLTVLEGKPHSHKDIGWKEFSEAVIQVLSKQERPMVFIFWGKAALHYAPLIENKARPYFLVLKSAHPSPLSARNFFGCRHFSKANEFLQKFASKPIRWELS